MNRNNTMKLLNIFKKSTPLLLLTAMSPVMATDITVPLNFTTLPVITITTAPGGDLDFGPVLSLTLADTCTMGTNDVGGTALTPSEEGADATSTATFTSVLTAANAGLLSGDCAGGANGNVGRYIISSFKDANITVTVSTGTATEISFEPAGYVTDLVEGTAFQRDTLNTSTPALVNASTALTAFGQEGTNVAVVGGTITNFSQLTAGGDYATDFNLNVVYQ